MSGIAGEMIIFMDSAGDETVCDWVLDCSGQMSMNTCSDHVVGDLMFYKEASASEA